MTKLHLNIFLLIGQSNMAGRGDMDEVEEIGHPDIFMFRKRKWVIAKEPLHEDIPNAGIGLGMSFALNLIEEYPGSKIGLVPYAVGGTPLSRWTKGADLYLASLVTVKEAMKDGTLKGILWHQGENDSGNKESASTYRQRFISMITSIREELDFGNIPVIIGQLGEFLKEHDNCKYLDLVNESLKTASQTLPLCGYVSSKD